MKISYAITVYNEEQEIQKLISLLNRNRIIDDQIIVMVDEKNATQKILDLVRMYYENAGNSYGDWIDSTTSHIFNNDYSEHKNRLNEFCSGEYIFQIDADELVSEYLLKNIHNIIDINPNIDLFFIPRINTVDGLTQEYITKWGWNVNEKGWINWPDFQGRLYKNKSEIKWQGKVHERIIGAEKHTYLPQREEYCLIHKKTIERQIKQNKFYEELKK
jgi:hypothetical protein